MIWKPRGSERLGEKLSGRNGIGKFTVANKIGASTLELHDILELHVKKRALAKQAIKGGGTKTRG